MDSINTPDNLPGEGSKVTGKVTKETLFTKTVSVNGEDIVSIKPWLKSVGSITAGVASLIGAGALGYKLGERRTSRSGRNHMLSIGTDGGSQSDTGREPGAQPGNDNGAGNRGNTRTASAAAR